MIQTKSPITQIKNETLLELLHPLVFERVGRLEKVSENKEDIEKVIYHHNDGVINVLRDFNSILLHVLMKDGKEVVKFKIRDRRFDGTPNYVSFLTDWSYDAPYDKVDCPAVELSRYSRDPDKYFLKTELTTFVREPFDYIFGDPSEFLELWQSAFVTGHYPGQSALPLKGAANYFADNARGLVNQLGYEVTVSPSHHYVAAFGLSRGYKFQSSAQNREYDEIENLFSEFNLDPKIEKQQKSWIILLQKFPSLHKSQFSDYWLKGLEYPLYYDGKHAENVWLYPQDSGYEFKDYLPEQCLKRLATYEFNRIKK
ncbi:hypothetical protein J4418_05040 [Candidatus Woesearchaeota archaeon]|nr:hypothetical protein [Candidatus Woesearchaeota archaeon]